MANAIPDEVATSLRGRCLALARAFVTELYKDMADPDRPYGVADMREVLSQILTIAEFLAGEFTTVHEDVLTQIRDEVKRIYQGMP